MELELEACDVGKVDDIDPMGPRADPGRLGEVVHRLLHPEEHELVVAVLLVLDEHRPAFPLGPLPGAEGEVDLLRVESLEPRGDLELRAAGNDRVPGEELDGERGGKLDGGPRAGGGPAPPPRGARADR